MSNLINRFVAITALNEAQIEFDANYRGLGEAKEIIDSLPTVNAIVIPDNATNGDMIKALFPNALIYVNTTLKQVFLCTYDDKFDEDFDRHITFPLNWWNAPYKKGENK